MKESRQMRTIFQARRRTQANLNRSERFFRLSGDDVAIPMFPISQPVVIVHRSLRVIDAEAQPLYASREILRSTYLSLSASQQASEKSCYRDSADSVWKHIVHAQGGEQMLWLLDFTHSRMVTFMEVKKDSLVLRSGGGPMATSIIRVCSNSVVFVA
jgi:hypothetical protein